MANDLQTTSPTPTCLPLLDDKLTELVLGPDSPVVGPKSAAVLRDFAAQPEPPLPNENQVDTMLAKLALATAKTKTSPEEAKARLELYWIALRDIPLDDLRAGFVHLLQTATFLPTPAEVRRAARYNGAVRRHAKSRAAWLVKIHEREWREPTEMVKPEEVHALMMNVNLGEAA